MRPLGLLSFAAAARKRGARRERVIACSTRENALNCSAGEIAPSPAAAAPGFRSFAFPSLSLQQAVAGGLHPRVAQGNNGFLQSGIIAAWAAWRFDFYTVKSLKS